MKKGLGKAAKSFAFGVMIDLVFSWQYSWRYD
jgi:hypothetical protein